MQSLSRFWVEWVVALILMAAVRSASAQDFLTLGARGGVSLNVPSHRFEQVEGFGDFDLPWNWNFYSDWRLQPRVDASAGWLNNRQDGAFIGTVGPLLEVRPGKCPFALEGGFSPTLLSRYRFGGADFGGRLQFTTQIGLRWYLTDRLAVGLRFQHMSNGGLESPNPGLNFEMLELSYHF